MLPLSTFAATRTIVPRCENRSRILLMTTSRFDRDVTVTLYCESGYFSKIKKERKKERDGTCTRWEETPGTCTRCSVRNCVFPEGDLTSWTVARKLQLAHCWRAGHVANFISQYNTMGVLPPWSWTGNAFWKNSHWHNEPSDQSWKEKNPGVR